MSEIDYMTSSHHHLEDNNNSNEVLSRSDLQWFFNQLNQALANLAHKNDTLFSLRKNYGIYLKNIFQRTELTQSFMQRLILQLKPFLKIIEKNDEISKEIIRNITTDIIHKGKLLKQLAGQDKAFIKKLKQNEFNIEDIVADD